MVQLVCASDEYDRRLSACERRRRVEIFQASRFRNHAARSRLAARRCDRRLGSKRTISTRTEVARKRIEIALWIAARSLDCAYRRCRNERDVSETSRLDAQRQQCKPLVNWR